MGNSVDLYVAVALKVPSTEAGDEAWVKLWEDSDFNISKWEDEPVLEELEDDEIHDFHTTGNDDVNYFYYFRGEDCEYSDTFHWIPGETGNIYIMGSFHRNRTTWDKLEERKVKLYKIALTLADKHGLQVGDAIVWAAYN